jgi:hypothetical protein
VSREPSPVADPAPWPAWPLALACALLPFVTVHVSFLVSAAEGHVGWCFPYWEGCSSISRAGRYGSAYFLFKGGMIPLAVLLVPFWWLNRLWLQSLGSPGGRALPWLGLTASLALLVYTLVLGHAGDAFHTLRRIGVIGWFGLTWLAQLQLGAALRPHDRWGVAGRRLVAMSLAALVAGIASLIAGLVFPDRHDDLEDAFEWTMALLLNVHVLIVALLWRRSGFTLRAGSG